MQVRNSPALRDGDPSRVDTSDWSLQNLFNSCSETSKNLTNDSSTSYSDMVLRTDPDMLKWIDAAQKMRNKTSDAELIHDFDVTIPRSGPVMLN